MDLIKEAIQAILSFSSDAIIILVIIGLGAIYSYMKGKGSAVSFLLAFYPAMVIFQHVPFFGQYTASDPATSTQVIVELLVFFAILIVISFAIGRVVSAGYSYSKMRDLFDSLIFGVLFMGLTLVVAFHVIDVKPLYNFSAAIDALFSSTLMIWWLVAPLAVIYFLK